MKNIFIRYIYKMNLLKTRQNKKNFFILKNKQYQAILLTI